MAGRVRQTEVYVGQPACSAAVHVVLGRTGSPQVPLSLPRLARSRQRRPSHSICPADRTVPRRPPARVAFDAHQLQVANAVALRPLRCSGTQGVNLCVRALHLSKIFTAHNPAACTTRPLAQVHAKEPPCTPWLTKCLRVKVVVVEQRNAAALRQALQQQKAGWGRQVACPAGLAAHLPAPQSLSGGATAARSCAATQHALRCCWYAQPLAWGEWSSRRSSSHMKVSPIHLRDKKPFIGIEAGHHSWASREDIIYMRHRTSLPQPCTMSCSVVWCSPAQCGTAQYNAPADQQLVLGLPELQLCMPGRARVSKHR